MWAARRARSVGALRGRGQASHASSDVSWSGVRGSTLLHGASSSAAFRFHYSNKK